ncbi:hypothetical protein BDW69DRAFT_201976 [Aspergillus filifer]
MTNPNPYEADPANIPASDLYADVPFHGRYFPKPDDFRVDPQHINSHTADSIRYWASVVDLCTKDVQIYPADEGGRDVFALGSIIVKSSHPHNDGHGCPETNIDFSYADANEIKAIAFARTVLEEVRGPDIYFAGKINGRQVLVQERLPGVGFCVAQPYLSEGQRDDFKKQARRKLDRRCHVIVSLIDWEMAGFFGWKTAGQVHREEQLKDNMYWNDLYDV